MARVSLKNIFKNYNKVKVLQNVNLEVRHAEFLSLVGPSGCGKSTLLKIIAGLEEQTSGQIKIENSGVDHLTPKARNIAMVFQSYALYPHLTVQENLAVPLELKQYQWFQRNFFYKKWFKSGQVKDMRVKDTVKRTAALLNIQQLLTRKPGQLSGGQKQRVALGKAIVRKPRVFLMDEPLSNLDAKLRGKMRTEIVELYQKLGTTIIYVTHDQVEAMTMSSRVAVMIDGKILQVGTPKEIYSNPQSIKVAEFIGTPPINIIPALRKDSHCLDAYGFKISYNLDNNSDKFFFLGIRPESFKIISKGSGFAGKIIHEEYLGSFIICHVKIKAYNKPIIVLIKELEGTIPRINDRVILAPIINQIILFDRKGNRIAVENKSDLPGGSLQFLPQ